MANIIAIDFGTAYSGYAFCMTPTEIDPYVKRWGKELGKDTPKTPTCILFGENERFLKFGYEAKNSYLNMRKDETRKHCFFENFKMALYGTKLNSDVTIKAANGKSMTALKVFTEALRYLKEGALKTISGNTHGQEFTASDFTWVLTVPAIWDASAKQFMREAATQAGIVTSGTEERLLIALEPEAASVWCKRLPADGFITQHHDRKALDQSPGTQYIVVDCGGGTIDITVHKVMEGGALTELHKASGNDLGGQNVDGKFKKFLRDIFSAGVWDEYENKYPSDVQRMMDDFTFLKQVDEDVEISCPYNLGQQAQKRQDMEKYFRTVQGASWDEGSIRISKDKMRSFFAESLKGISQSIREILRDQNIEFILLVGGYAQSQVLRQHVIDQFGRQCKVLCPFRPQEAIMKGAVMFGRNPAVVESRKSAFTYGVSVTERFDQLKHRADKKFTTGGREMCADVFLKLVEEGEDVACNETRKFSFNPVEADQREMKLLFYRTRDKNPTYVDEEGVQKVGSFSVDVSDTTGARDRTVKVEMKFGFTELTVTAVDVTSGKTKSIRINFMTKEPAGPRKPQKK
ncbi:heat shock 70 kDa protein 12A-like [Parambassis ranga]|uniref:Heat shock 70 kDa protein 12A-like n=1 Tax=Parambassis ranga TaxID=210632 RepID=A0A6P7KMI7_9TELE|nr:heat shock 70 kDa protein 12A-like [Parambassis ranga]